MTDRPRPLVVLARLMQVADDLAGTVPGEIEAACLLREPEALGSSDVEALVEYLQLGTALLEETVASLTELRRDLSRRAGALMPVREQAKPWGIVRRDVDASWSEWDHEGLIRALAPKMASALGLETNEVRGVIEALPARPDWRPGAIRDEWGEDPEEFARHATGRRTIRTQRTDKLAAVAAEMTDPIPTGDDDG